MYFCSDVLLLALCGNVLMKRFQVLPFEVFSILHYLISENSYHRYEGCGQDSVYLKMVIICLTRNKKVSCFHFSCILAIIKRETTFDKGNHVFYVHN